MFGCWENMKIKCYLPLTYLDGLRKVAQFKCSLIVSFNTHFLTNENCSSSSNLFQVSNIKGKPNSCRVVTITFFHGGSFNFMLIHFHLSAAARLSLFDWADDTTSGVILSFVDRASLKRFFFHKGLVAPVKFFSQKSSMWSKFFVRSWAADCAMWSNHRFCFGKWIRQLNQNWITIFPRDIFRTQLFVSYKTRKMQIK